MLCPPVEEAEQHSFLVAPGSQLHGRAKGREAAGLEQQLLGWEAPGSIPSRWGELSSGGSGVLKEWGSGGSGDLGGVEFWGSGVLGGVGP